MPNTRRYQKFFQFITLVIIYVVGMNLFIFLKMLGFTELKAFPEISATGIMIFTSATAFVIAILIGLLELKVFNRWNNFSLLSFIVFKYSLIALVVVLGSIIVYCLFVLNVPNITFGAVIQSIPNFLKSQNFLATFIYLVVFSIFFNMFRVLMEHLGPQALQSVLTGKYNKPLEEDRTFIFLDLTASTTIGEKLGHSQYSLFIHECFQILTQYIYKYEAVLYQFVGDEAVLSWKTSAAKKALSPLQLYFDFSEHLEKEKEKFNEHYGITPKFKAAIHTGLVTISKIQSTKSEIVYHGDVLNTCARMVEQCSILGKDILASEFIAEWIEKDKRYATSFVEQLLLRGKENDTKLYEVRKSYKKIDMPVNI